MFENSNWIKSYNDFGDVCPAFKKEFKIDKEIKKATVSITATGVYEAHLNGKRVGDFIMAPGFTAYNKRHQYQTYDITNTLKEENEFLVTVGKGWFRSPLTEYKRKDTWGGVSSIICEFNIDFKDGTKLFIPSDKTWQCGKSNILFSEIYDGETFDATKKCDIQEPVTHYRYTKSTLIKQQGEKVTENEIIDAKDMFYTPSGQLVVDFGQNLAGYVEFDITAKENDILEYKHAEILDKDGNFYTGNLRTAKQTVKYICKEGRQTYKPHHTFMGFRYIHILNAPKNIKKENFKAIAVYSDMERTGHFSCSNEKINKLYENIIWGQRSNFLDIPTDCPQRDERLGWTGDAQIYIKTASYNYNVKKFFTKWLSDLKAEQFENGGIPNVIPDLLNGWGSCAAWADASVICPWQIYLTYADKTILKNHIKSMIKWIEYMHNHGDNEFLYIDANFGDWLGLDSKEGDLKGATRDGFISCAYYAYSTSLVVKALKVLGKDSTYYENLHKGIVSEFQKEFDTYFTQTECALALVFDLAPDKEKTAKQLADMIEKSGGKLQTGFVGTPYLLDALADNGYTLVAYDLLFSEENPSWLFSVNQGATTVWEHWDGIKKDGTFWSDKMNSFNHYAYGSVASFFYEKICGINIDETKPGFEHIILKPQITDRLDFAKASIKTKYGIVESEWIKEKDNKITFKFKIPSSATFVFGEKATKLKKGEYTFTKKLTK
ncbi:MAG: alfa-L-rhamnosidase [Ruminococcaceae bacterium]|nr:alfa-L-rhamnosidase [Oscillospiraceae bacterium]